MNMRIKTSRAGITEAPIIQTGKGCLSPNGLTNQLRLSGDVTEKPEGTFSFCNHKKTQVLVSQRSQDSLVTALCQTNHTVIQTRKKPGSNYRPVFNKKSTLGEEFLYGSIHTAHDSLTVRLPVCMSQGWCSPPARR